MTMPNRKKNSRVEAFDGSNMPQFKEDLRASLSRLSKRVGVNFKVGAARYGKKSAQIVVEATPAA